ncbi:RluA family pseudouridine synthase [Georgenia sp. MJ173]|uniref:RluA family pseudouridine synthase n=1 Tax=Georgenia sunbinii TaxID=3117728 RepID=UPI002F262276
MADIRALPVPEGLAGERVDAALARLLGFSRTRAAEIAQAGAVLLDGRELGKSDRLVAGGWLEVTMPETATPPPEPVVGLAIAYEDEDLVVVDKPVGVAAHPSPGWTGPTVVGGLRAAGFQVSSFGPAERQGIVHRLDAGTSGLMAVAKSDLAYTGLKRAFKERTVHKIYHALVQGHMDPLNGTIDAPVGRHPSHDYRFAVVADGKHAVTHYRTLEAMPGASLLEIDLETGRTHQIRVHTSAVRHPCVGDTTYGSDPLLAERLGLTRQWLHAMRLAFDHPRDGRPVVVTSEYPADLAAALEEMRG